MKKKKTTVKPQNFALLLKEVKNRIQRAQASSEASIIVAQLETVEKTAIFCSIPQGNIGKVI